MLFTRRLLKYLVVFKFELSLIIKLSESTKKLLTNSYSLPNQFSIIQHHNVDKFELLTDKQVLEEFHAGRFSSPYPLLSINSALQNIQHIQLIQQTLVIIQDM